MQERLDLGPCRAIRHAGSIESCAVLLPGQFYPTRAPLLWFAREAVLSQGWSALEVLGEPGEHSEPLAWERECAQRAIGAAGPGRVAVIGKSLASLLADMINDRGLPAAWLTPIMTEPSVRGALAQAREPTLLVGGTADSTWEADAVPSNPALAVLEVPEADHSLQIQGDLAASLNGLRLATEAILAWLPA